MIRTSKTILTATAAAFLAFPAAAQTEIAWWDFLAGGDGVRMRALIDRFNEEHEDIQITPTTLEWGVPFYTKVRTSAAVGQGPDIMTYHLSRMPLGLEEGVLSPITDADLEAAGLSMDDFYPSAVEAAKGPDGQLYAVPFDIHSIVLYYNKSYLEGTEFLDADGNLTGITDLESFERAIEAAASNGSTNPLSFQTGGEAGVWRVFYTMMGQMDGEFMTDGEVLAGENSDKAVRALQIMQQWRDNDWIPQQAEYEASVALFTSGQSAFHMNGVWEVPTLKDMEANGTLGFEWGAVQVPAFLGQPATWADSHAFAIPAQGEDGMDDETRAAVMQVIGWMSENSIGWADAGHIPAYLPTTQSAEYQAMEPNATYATLAETAFFEPRSRIAGVASPSYDATLNIMIPSVHGFFPPEEAVEEIKSELGRALN